MKKEIQKLFDLTGKTAIVTGASRGLGRALAEALAGAGADLLVNSRHLKEIEKAAGEISQKTGRKVIGIEADITSSKEANGIVEKTIEAFGKVDILVNNAGVMVRKKLTDHTDEEIDAVLDANIKGSVYLCRAVAGEMIKNGWGRIINIGSLHSIVSIAERPLYAASKGGIMQFSKSIALEWAKHGINVNVICPGVFKTEINTDWMNDKTKADKMLEKIPVGYFAEPGELAGTLIFLASEASNYITGTAIIVDGGFTAQ